jgi:hypothetical protein
MAVRGNSAVTCAGLVVPADLTAQRGPGVQSRLIAVCVASLAGVTLRDVSVPLCF